MSTTTTVETDDDLAELQERLEAIEYDTLGGGRCLATVTDIRETARADSVRVVSELPSGREYDETFTVPEVADDSSRLVRFLEARGYGLSTIDHLVGSDVEVEVTDDEPEYVVPDKPTPWTERVWESIPDPALSGLYLVCGVLAMPMFSYLMVKEADEYERDIMVTFGFMASVMWFLIGAIMTVELFKAIV